MYPERNLVLAEFRGQRTYSGRIPRQAGVVLRTFGIQDKKAKRRAVALVKTNHPVVNVVIVCSQSGNGHQPEQQIVW